MKGREAGRDKDRKIHLPVYAPNIWKLKLTQDQALSLEISLIGRLHYLSPYQMPLEPLSSALTSGWDQKLC